MENHGPSFVHPFYARTNSTLPTALYFPGILLSAILLYLQAFMESRKAAFVISALYFLFGVLLFIGIPRYNAFYQSIHLDWDANPDFFVRAFHLPAYSWLVLFTLLAGLVLYIGFVLQDKLLKCINLGLLLLLIVLALFVFDWLTGYIFCHSWGCTQALFRF
jgi:hypothetical protein